MRHMDAIILEKSFKKCKQQLVVAGQLRYKIASRWLNKHRALRKWHCSLRGIPLPEEDTYGILDE